MIYSCESSSSDRLGPFEGTKFLFVALATVLGPVCYSCLSSP
jgi:hypothetical protein